MAYIRRLSSRVSSVSDFLFVNFYSRHEYSFLTIAHLTF